MSESYEKKNKHRSKKRGGKYQNKTQDLGEALRHKSTYTDVLGFFQEEFAQKGINVQDKLTKLNNQATNNNLNESNFCKTLVINDHKEKQDEKIIYYINKNQNYFSKLQSTSNNISKAYESTIYDSLNHLGLENADIKNKHSNQMNVYNKLFDTQFIHKNISLQKLKIKNYLRSIRKSQYNYFENNLDSYVKVLSLDSEFDVDKGDNKLIKDSYSKFLVEKMKNLTETEKTQSDIHIVIKNNIIMGLVYLMNKIFKKQLAGLDELYPCLLKALQCLQTWKNMNKNLSPKIDLIYNMFKDTINNFNNFKYNFDIGSNFFVKSCIIVKECNEKLHINPKIKTNFLALKENDKDLEEQSNIKLDKLDKPEKKVGNVLKLNNSLKHLKLKASVIDFKQGNSNKEEGKIIYKLNNYNL